MAPRIVFVVMSAVTPAPTVDQLAKSLAPHTVLVHHDFSQTPDFPLSAPNVRFVPEPRRTGWASFGFVDGMFHSMAHAVERLEFDYLQLLSPTCLPIKPMAQFEAHAAGPVDAHFGCIDLLADPDCLMWVGYRAFTPDGSLRHRVLRRLSMDYFRAATGRRDEAGIWLASGGGRNNRLQALVARAAVRAFSDPGVGRHPFGPQLRPYYGSTWFGAKRHVVQGMVEAYRRPGIRDYFSRLRIAEEFLMPTLLMQQVRTRGPLNHHVHKFVEAHPSKIGEHDIDMLRAAPAFFARKFPEDPAHPVRVRVLQELVRNAEVARHEPAKPVVVEAGADTVPARQEHVHAGHGLFPAGAGLQAVSASGPAA